MGENDDSDSRRDARRQKGLRFATGLNSGVAIMLAMALLGLVATIAYRYVKVRWDLSSLRYYTLSDKTHSMLSAIEGEIRVITLFEQDAILKVEVRRLLREYEHAAEQLEKLRVTVEQVDPNRDLARAREISDAFDVDEANVIIVTAASRHKVIVAKSLIEYDQSFVKSDKTHLLHLNRTKRGFRGEQVLSSAIQSLTQEIQPVVYFLLGHGERDIFEASSPSGYFRIVRLMKQDNIEIKPLLLAESGRIPDDCDALVIAGPDRQIASTELDVIRAYLKQSGRLMLLLDPATTTGLDETLNDWGVKLDHDVVVGLTLTGRELFIKDYGNHKITRGLSDIVTTFYMPRSIEPTASASLNGSAASDKPNVTVLATSEGYAERNLSQTPPRFDADVDREGPVSIAVAVELGVSGSIEVGLRPTRIVVFGDSDFVSNGAVESGAGGNLDLYLSSVNWLLDREELMAIAPKAPIDLRLDMDAKQVKQAFVLNVVAFPIVVLCFGVMVWISRRR